MYYAGGTEALAFVAKGYLRSSGPKVTCESQPAQHVVLKVEYVPLARPMDCSEQNTVEGSDTIMKHNFLCLPGVGFIDVDDVAQSQRGNTGVEQSLLAWKQK